MITINDYTDGERKHLKIIQKSCEVIKAAGLNIDPMRMIAANDGINHRYLNKLRMRAYTILKKKKKAAPYDLSE